MQCKRTYSELEWFHNHLTNYFPSTIIPVIPKISFFDKYTQEYINEKARYVKRFLNTLIHNPLIHYSKVFYDFLSLTEEDFKELMRKQNLEKAPTLIKKFETIDGRIAIGTGCDKDDEAEKIKQTIQDKDKAYEQLDKAIKDVIEQFGILSTKMNTLSKAFDNIKHSYKDSPVLKSVFDNLTQLSLKWSNSYAEHKEVFQCELREFLNYERMYMNNFLNIYQQYDTAKYKYMSQYLSYDSIKGLPNQTLKELNELRKWYGFHLNKLINEYNSLIKHVAVFDFQKQIHILNDKAERFYRKFNECSNLLTVNVDV